MCKFDITDAFKQLPLHPSVWHLHGIKWDGKFYFFVRLVFGSRSSPKIFDSLSQAICWIAEHRFNVRFILHLLDDFLTIDPTEEVAMRSMAIMTMIFNSLRVPLAAHKTFGPVQELEYLGLMLNSKTMTVFLPTNKMGRITAKISEFSTKRTVTKQELLSLLGHLNFAARVIIPGRSFISYLLQLASSVSQLHHHVTFTTACLSELSMWRQFLISWNGIHLILNSQVVSSSDLHIFTDASSTKGFGGYFQGSWFSEVWPPQLLSVRHDKLSMALLDLYPIVIAAMLWGRHWSQQRIRFNCDNQTTVHVLRKGRASSHCHSINALLRRLTLTAMKHNFIVLAQFVPGRQNSIADALSRFQLQKFHSLAPEAELNKTLCPPFCKVTLI
ncbi:uncharacterized protein LOC100369622 [Saccoglossus kowalevskii]|uniref:Uncharacterized protein LOC100369622 n=1 Tax=Saccoglossus kowalevskii TaxID=10224 RepID=A0ABM0MDF7_SACKO|nr:PREDICTED: uncharacterized protein LOC100369622 [Saccoglossus kowalevskii]